MSGPKINLSLNLYKNAGVFMTLVLLVAKSAGYLPISWLIVAAPLWLPLLVYFVILGLYFAFLVVIAAAAVIWERR